jgi:uncharacterized protein YnzC (UPF0291/DUF896 family)
MTENDIDRINEEANQAKIFLEDPFFISAVTTLNERIKSQWQQSVTTEAREHQWYKMQALREILQELRRPLDTAQVIANQMQE